MEFNEKVAKFAEISKDHSEQLERNEQIFDQQIDKLYKDIQSWFNESIQKEHINVDFNQQNQLLLSDDIIIDTMCLNFGNGEQSFTIVLAPTGNNAVGAIGKIDLYFQGHIDESIFLLLIEEDCEQFYWEMRKGRKLMEPEKFGKEVFEQLIDKWSNKWSNKWAEIAFLVPKFYLGMHARTLCVPLLMGTFLKSVIYFLVWLTPSIRECAGCLFCKDFFSASQRQSRFIGYYGFFGSDCR